MGFILRINITPPALGAARLFPQKCGTKQTGFADLRSRAFRNFYGKWRESKITPSCLLCKTLCLGCHGGIQNKPLVTGDFKRMIGEKGNPASMEPCSHFMKHPKVARGKNSTVLQQRQ